MVPVSLASPHASPDIQPLAKGVRARQARNKDTLKGSDGNGIIKKKQSKSRNGMSPQVRLSHINTSPLVFGSCAQKWN